MSKGSSQPTSTTVNQKTIPDQLLPYYTDAATQAENLSNQPYLPYTGQRLAGQSGATTQAYNLTNQLAGAGQDQVGYASDNYGQANSSFGQASNAVAGANANVPSNVTAQGWNDQTAQQYMNPYVQQALDPQIQYMNQQFQQQQAQRDSTAAQEGAFGGSRAALVNQAAQQGQNNTIAQTVGQGYLNAYNTGMSGFEQDASHNLSAQEANQQAGLTSNAQQLQGAQDLTAIGQGLNSTAAGQAALGQQQQNMLGTGINALYNAGQSQQNYTQQGLDIGYNDFQNQQNYPYQQLNYLSGIINGFNVPASTTTTSYTPTNPVTQLAGAGLGLSGILGNTKTGS